MILSCIISIPLSRDSSFNVAKTVNYKYFVENNKIQVLCILWMYFLTHSHTHLLDFDYEEIQS